MRWGDGEIKNALSKTLGYLALCNWANRQNHVSYTVNHFQIVTIDSTLILLTH